MSAETAKTVLVDVKRGGLGADSVTEEEIETLKSKVAKQYEEQSNPSYGTARLWDDGLIEPGQTRNSLGLCLSLAALKEPPDGPFRVIRM